MAEITVDMVKAELGRYALELMVLRAENTELKAASPTLETGAGQADTPPDEIATHKRPANIKAVDNTA